VAFLVATSMTVTESTPAFAVQSCRPSGETSNPSEPLPAGTVVSLACWMMLTVPEAGLDTKISSFPTMIM
jgi:hypothetical protein